MIMETMVREVLKNKSCQMFNDYRIHLKIRRNL